jgi:hypothetical protein
MPASSPRHARRRQWSSVTRKRFGCPDRLGLELARRRLANALDEVRESEITIDGVTSPTYLPTSLYLAFVHNLEASALPWTRYICFVEYDGSAWQATDVNTTVESVGFRGERARQVVSGLQAIASYPSRTKIDRDQIVRALRSCQVFPEYLREEHEAAAAVSARLLS